MPFPEIASEVFLARNTIKSQANSICRTLGAGSRGQGFARVRGLGLLDG